MIAPAPRRARTPAKLDEIDLEILCALRANARYSLKKIADRIGLASSSCLRRIRVLERRGVIKKYHAALDATKLGFPVSAMISVTLAKRTAEVVTSFERFTNKWPIIRECYTLHGNMDFLLRCIARDLTELDNFVRCVLIPTTWVQRAKTLVVFRISKAEANVPLEMSKEFIETYNHITPQHNAQRVARHTRRS